METLSRIRRGFVFRHGGTSTGLQDRPVDTGRAITDQLSSIQDLVSRLEAADAEGEARLPRSWWRFPINRIGFLEKLVLRIYNLLSKEQRTINVQLARALREAVGVNRDLCDRLAEVMEIYTSEVSSIRRELSEHRNLLARIGAQVHGGLPTVSESHTHQHDQLYVLLEQAFRGSPEEIKERARVYVDVVRNAGVGTESMPILDLGSGRGEWLELLQDEQLVGKGVEKNAMFVQQCMEQGLDVLRADAIAYLRAQPGASIGCVTGFHIVEHFLFEDLITLVDESVRVLKPGGIAIFETPNPDNVLVGSNHFYLDPTHVRPLPKALMQFLLESFGLADVRTIELHPLNPAAHVSDGDSQLVRRFNEYFYGPADYAVVGQKRGSRDAQTS